MQGVILDRRVGHTPARTQSDRAGSMIADLHRLGVPARLGSLEFGDVAFDGYGPSGLVPVGIELKSVTGLLGDIVTGRFAGHQVPGMQRIYPYRYLVVEGAHRPSSSDGLLEVPGRAGWCVPSPAMMYVDFMKIIDDIDLRAGFRVRRAWGWADTAQIVAAAYHGFQKKWDAHKALKQFNNAPPGVVLLTPPTLLRLWARDLPGIGWEKSAAVEDAFESPLQMARATQRAWEAVPGIGKVIASRAWCAIRGIE